MGVGEPHIGGSVRTGKKSGECFGTNQFVGSETDDRLKDHRELAAERTRSTRCAVSTSSATPGCNTFATNFDIPALLPISAEVSVSSELSNRLVILLNSDEVVTAAVMNSARPVSAATSPSSNAATDEEITLSTPTGSLPRRKGTHIADLEFTR